MVRKRPDLQIIYGPTNLLLDVTISHPCAPSYLDHARTPRYTIARAERAKRAKYAPIAAEHQALFLPFAMDTFGAGGDSAGVAIGHILSIAEDSMCTWSPAEVGTGANASVAVAIQRGNALTLREGLSRVIAANTSGPHRGPRARRGPRRA